MLSWGQEGGSHHPALSSKEVYQSGPGFLETHLPTTEAQRASSLLPGWAWDGIQHRLGPWDQLSWDSRARDANKWRQLDIVLFTVATQNLGTEHTCPVVPVSQSWTSSLLRTCLHPLPPNSPFVEDGCRVSSAACYPGTGKWAQRENLSGPAG